MMKNDYRFILPLMLLTFMFISFSCAPAKDQAGVIKITADELLDKQSQGIMVIDIRTLSEVNEGKIPGANHIPLSDEFIRSMGHVSKDQPVIVYCQAGSRSGRASQMLLEAGYLTVFDYSGGMGNWRSLGKAVD